MKMAIRNLTVDLLQDQATVALFKQGEQRLDKPGSAFSSVNITVPILTPGDQLENQLKRNALVEAKKVLEEAIQVLDASTAN